ncbi:dihydrolipoyl dehydrogenase, partial [Pseudomonas aeruginosa]
RDLCAQPEVASVGVGEEELQGARGGYKVGRFPFSASRRAKINHESECFIKILSDCRSDKVLGVHMIGPGVSEMIGEACVAMEFSASERGG